MNSRQRRKQDKNRRALYTQRRSLSALMTIIYDLVPSLSMLNFPTFADKNKLVMKYFNNRIK